MGKVNKRTEGSRLKSLMFAGISIFFWVMTIGGLYAVANATGNIPEFRTKKQLAYIRMEKERLEIRKAKASCPELYPESEDYYLADFKELWEKAPDTR